MGGNELMAELEGVLIPFIEERDRCVARNAVSGRHGGELTPRMHAQELIRVIDAVRARQMREAELDVETRRLLEILREADERLSADAAAERLNALPVKVAPVPDVEERLDRLVAAGFADRSTEPEEMVAAYEATGARPRRREGVSCGDA